MIALNPFLDSVCNFKVAGSKRAEHGVAQVRKQFDGKEEKIIDALLLAPQRHNDKCVWH